MASKSRDHIAASSTSTHQSRKKRRRQGSEGDDHRKSTRRNKGKPTVAVIEALSPSVTSTMCADCQKIDFNSVFYEHALSSNKNQPGYVVAILSHLDPRQSRQCDCCSFLASIAQANIPGEQDDFEVEYQLVAYSTVKNLAPKLKASLGHNDKPILTVIAKSLVPTVWTRPDSPQHFFVIAPHDHVPSPDQLQIRCISPSVDWQVPKRWLDHCCLNHGSSCNKSQTNVGLRVLDCSNPDDPRLVELVDLPGLDTRYVALSYVWGNQNDSKPSPKQLIHEAPLVVQDAMAVVRALGFQFLWIDRYCIPQADDRAKHRLIQHMNEVYRGSSLTIIAAAGEDPDFGLPGVSRERQCTSLRYDSFSLVPFDRDGSLNVDQSRWNARAWTYQEGLLSIKKLYFTSQGMYYQCAAMTHAEHIVFPLHLDSMQRSPLCRYGYGPAPVLPLINSRKSFGPAEFDYRVSEYHNRQLSFNHDAMNAFKGVLQHFETVSGMRHLWGIPLETARARSLIIGLTWRCRDCQGGERRIGFPSWSWTGWKAHDCTGFRCLEFGNGRFPDFEQPASGFKVAIKFCSSPKKRAIDWGKPNTRAILERAKIDPEPPQIRLFAPISARCHDSSMTVTGKSFSGSVAVKWKNSWRNIRMFGFFYKTDIAWYIHELWGDNEERFRLVLLTHRPETPTTEPELQIMVVRRCKAPRRKIYERVGLLVLKGLSEEHFMEVYEAQLEEITIG